MTALLVFTSLVGCKSGDNQNKSSSSEVEVIHVASVSVSPARASIYLNDEHPSIQLEAVVLPETAANKKVTWASSDPTIATVDENGLVTGLKQGKVSVTATSEDGQKTGASNISIKVDRTQDATIDQLNKPTFYSRYERNTATLDDVSKISTNSNPDRTTYYQNEQKTRDFYKVGSQNEFRAQVTGKVTDDDGVDTTVTNPFTKIKVELFDEENKEYKVLENDSLSVYVSISVNHNSYKFNEAAEGKRFRITVSVDETMYANVSEECSDVVMEVEVFDGYNVYSKEELSLFDNQQNDVWNEIRASKGIENVTAHGLALHSSFTFENSDVPSRFRYSQQEVDTWASKYEDDVRNWVAAKEANKPADSEEVFSKDTMVDSLKDWTTLFLHKTMAEDENFAFEGNYFTIDIKNVKQILAFGSSSLYNGNVFKEYQPDGLLGANGSHGQIFGINTDLSDCGGSSVQIKNMTVIGNGERSDNDNYLGGLIGFKTKSVDLLFQNVISSKTFITFLTEKEDNGNANITETTFDRCKNFDSYNSLLYFYGTDHNTITNSFMVGAGGAIALLDEFGANDRTSSRQGIPEVNCYNVYFENLLTGLEPWFKGHQATQLVQLMQLFGAPDYWLGRNAMKNGQHKTLLATNGEKQFLDLIAINMCADAPLDNDLLSKGRMLEGKFNIYNDPELTQVVAGLDMSRAKVNGFDDLQGIATAWASGNPLPLYRAMGYKVNSQAIVVESSAGGHGMLYSSDFKNGVIAGLNDTDYPDALNDRKVPVAEGVYLTPWPFYDGTNEVAYNLGRASNMDKLASGDYMSVFLQPAAPTSTSYYEFVGCFAKLHTLGA